MSNRVQGDLHVGRDVRARGIDLDGPSVINVDSSSDALRVTQTGSGNAFVVEDSASPDATPFVIDADGRVGIGTTSPADRLHVRGTIRSDRFTTDAAANAISFRKARGTSSSPTVVSSGDNLGFIQFWGYDGSADTLAAQVVAAVDGTPGSGDMPGRLVFSTTANGSATLAERMRITSNGFVGIGQSTPSSFLWVNTNVNTDAGAVTTTARGTLMLANSSGGTQAVGNLGPSIAFTGINSGRRKAMISSVQTGSNANQTGLAFFTFNGTTTTTDAVVEAVRITSAGNVGIGTSSPTNILQVESNSATTIRFDRNTSDATSAVVQMFKRRGTSASKVIVNNGDSTGEIVFHGYDGANDRFTALIRSSVDGTPGAGDMPGRLTFFTVPDGSTTLNERLRINNAGFITGTGTSLGAWTAWTPTWTNLTVGNGTVLAFFCQVGKTVHVRVEFTFGSTTTVSGRISSSLPVSNRGSGVQTVNGYFVDASATADVPGQFFISGQGVFTSGLDANRLWTPTSTTVPFTWATSDRIIFSGTYEAA